ncbi:MAG: hypothetical protein JO263_00865 [Candidatus Eremiobacteraeota bacterium]|nr:hypothetical protein [Candidatus Eremiobacteraeota bacterium]
MHRHRTYSPLSVVGLGLAFGGGVLIVGAFLEVQVLQALTSSGFGSGRASMDSLWGSLPTLFFAGAAVGVVAAAIYNTIVRILPSADRHKHIETIQRLRSHRVVLKHEGLQHHRLQHHNAARP